MEKLYSRLAPIWDWLLAGLGFKRGLTRYIQRVASDDDLSAPRILDVGCGTGIASFALLDIFPDASVTATDLNYDMVKETRQVALRTGYAERDLTVARSDVLTQDTIELLDGTERELTSGSFDIIIASGVLEYTPLDTAIPKLLSLLKPGGKLIIISIKSNWVGKIWGAMYKFTPIDPKDMERHIKNEGKELVFEPLSFREFPANVTRTGCFLTK